MSKLRIAVVGVGYFGRHHAKHLSEMADVQLVGVVDADERTAQTIAQRTATRAFCDPAAIVDQVDAVCVAVPTVAHLEVAGQFLKRGIPTLVEKPLALSTDEARTMVELAEQNDALLQVGHIERFNPAWSAVENADFRPQFIEAQRYSPFPFRSLDVSVVFDIMIHDLDLAMAVTRSTVTHIEATGTRVLSPSSDRADAWLRFANGSQVRLSASRAHHESVRTMRLWDSKRCIELDFAHRTGVETRLRPGDDSAASLADVSTLTMEEKNSLRDELFATTKSNYDKTADPLRAELSEFVRCVRQRRQPLVDGAHGMQVVTVASQIEQIIAANEDQRSLRRSA